ncbi:MAG: PAS-domain containing protein [Pseudomonadota bacterium]
MAATNKPIEEAPVAPSSLLDALPTPIAGCDMLGRVRYCNPSWYAAFGAALAPGCDLAQILSLPARGRLAAWLAGQIAEDLHTHPVSESGPFKLRRLAEQMVDDSILICAVDTTTLQHERQRLSRVEQAAGLGSWELGATLSDLTLSSGVLRLHDAAGLRNVMRCYPPVERRRLYRELRSLVQHQLPIDVLLTMRGAAGRQVRCRAWIEDAAPDRVCGTVQDVTDEANTARKLRRFGAIAKTLSTCVVLTDLDNRIEWVNEGFVRLFGIRLEEACGLTPRDLQLSDVADPSMLAYFSECRRTGQHGSAEVFNRDRTGRELEVLIDMQPTHDEMGALSGFLYILTEIGARKRAERELRAAEAAATTARARLVSAIEALDDAFVLFDADDRLILCNERYRQQHAYLGELIKPGVTFEAILRESLRLGEPEDARGQEEDWLQQRLARHREEKSESEYFVQGSWIRMSEKATPEGGRVGLRSDITELKSKQTELQIARDALDAQRELLETTLESLEQAVHVFDPDLNLIYFNQRFLQLTRLSRAEIRLGMKADEILRFRHARGDYGDVEFEPFADRRLNLLRGRVPHRFLAEQPDGRVLQVVGKPLPSGGLVTTYQDITAEELLRNDLRRARSDAESANAAKSRLLANVSHEIRTPLNGVLGMAQALRDTSLSEQQAEMLDLVESSGRSLVAIINDVLDLSKIEAGKFDLIPRPFNLKQLIDEVERNHSFRAVERRLVFRITCDPASDGWYIGDDVRVRQILDNLLSNAFRYTQAGGVYLAVGHTVADDGDSVELSFSVRDTGIGISRERMLDLFRPFVQAGDVSNRQSGGTGLGLAITRELCEMMEGSIEVDSEIGVGSTFNARIRLVRTDERAVKEDDSSPHNRQILARLGLRILVAEDNATNQVVVRHMLRKINARLTMVGNGEEALQAWAPGRFDVLLLDISMPLRDGVEVTAQIRRSEAEIGATRTPIAALTAHAMAHEIGSYLSSGMDAHIAKPIREESLLDTLARLVLPKEMP